MVPVAAATWFDGEHMFTRRASLPAVLRDINAAVSPSLSGLGPAQVERVSTHSFL